jgi:acetyltransferase-like isoleucine patch superfamily enzyme
MDAQEAFDLFDATDPRWPKARIYWPCLILNSSRVQIADGARIDSFVKIEGGLGVEIGECVHIGSFSQVNIGGGKVSIGAHVGVGGGARFVGGTNLPEGESMSAASPREMQYVLRGEIVVEPYAFVGTNAVVLPSVRVGEGAILAAGGVATHNIPAWEIWGGVPARFMRVRERPVRIGRFVEYAELFESK